MKENPAFYFRDLFERREINQIKNLSLNPDPDLNICFFSQQAMAKMLLACSEKKWDEALKRADEILNKSMDDQIQLIALYYATAVTEVIYDMNARSQWMDKWSFLDLSSSWSRFLKTFQEGVGSFFEGHLVQAETIFQQALELAETIDDPWSRSQSHFHLALVSLDRKLEVQADRHLDRALEIANKENYHRLQERIRSAKGQSTEDSLNLLDELIEKRQLKTAQRILNQAVRKRIEDGRSRLSSTELWYTAFLCFYRGKTKSFLVCYSYLKDPVWRCQLLDRIRSHPGFSKKMLQEYQWLQEVLGIHQTYLSKTTLSTGNLPKEMQNFIKALLCRPEGLSKEEISKALWNGYDPLVHDSKIYKLVMKLRQKFGNECISNIYGGYRLA